MLLSPKKLVTIVTEAVIERQLLEELDGLGVTGYTVTEARGRGHRGVRAEQWEHGTNVRIEVLCDQDLAHRIIEKMKESYYPHFAMILHVADVGVLRPEKF